MWDNNTDAKAKVYVSVLKLLSAIGQESYAHHIYKGINYIPNICNPGLPCMDYWCMIMHDNIKHGFQGNFYFQLSPQSGDSRALILIT